MQAADHAAGDEERKRDDHAAGAAADGVERAGTAAIGELHADAEHERADQQRRPERRDRAAEARAPAWRPERSRRAAMAISSKPPSKPSACPRTMQPPPRRGEAEFGLEEHDAQRKAEHDQRGGGGLAVDQDQRNQHRGGQHRRDQERPVEARQRRRSAGFGGSEAHGFVSLRGPAAGSGAEAERLLHIVPAGARRGDRAARVGGPLDHRAVVEAHVGPTEHHRQHEPVGRRPMAGVAVADDRTGRKLAGDRGKLFLRAQLVGRRIVERRAVEIDRARDVAVGLRRRRLLPAVEEARRPRIEQRRAGIAAPPLRPRPAANCRSSRRRSSATAGSCRTRPDRTPPARPRSRRRGSTPPDGPRPSASSRHARPQPKSVALTPAGTITTWLSSSMPVSPISFSSSAVVGSMNGTPLRVTRQPALS